MYVITLAIVSNKSAYKRRAKQQLKVRGFMKLFKSLLFRSSISVCLGASVCAAQPISHARRNVIIFVADGLRYGSVNAKDTPTLWKIRQQGVDFRNGHSVFPTFTTANASAIATGHGLGDTGDFSNTIYIGYKALSSGDFKSSAGSITPFLENDQILSDLDARYGGNYLGEPTLLSAALAEGYSVASVGKLGPTAIQQVEAISAQTEGFPTELKSIILDDATGSPEGVPIPESLRRALQEAGLSIEAPTRSNGYGPHSPWNNGNAGDAANPGTRQANLVQEQWFTDATTRVLLPQFASKSDKGFILLFWSRDPDGTQHNEGDSLQSIAPGINGPSPTLALRNADHCLEQIMAWLDRHPTVKKNTDIFVTSDHGFATISRREIGLHTPTKALSVQHEYLPRADGAPSEPAGTLPAGFLAIDLALGLHTHLFDPSLPSHTGAFSPYEEIRLDEQKLREPIFGSAILGDAPKERDGSDAQAIVAANGGSDLIYVPDHNPAIVQRIVSILTGLDYVGGIFVDDQYGQIPGTLPLSTVGLVGASRLPRPAIVVAFKVFYRHAGDLLSAVQVSDTSLQEGQGMHGGFGRDSTFNNMEAIGPDFKRTFADGLPASNMDIVPTLASILGIPMPHHGTLRGRVLREAMTDGAQSQAAERKIEVSTPATNGFSTILEYQEFDGYRYYDRACFVDLHGSKSCVP